MEHVPPPPEYTPIVHEIIPDPRPDLLQKLSNRWQSEEATITARYDQFRSESLDRYQSIVHGALLDHEALLHRIALEERRELDELHANRSSDIGYRYTKPAPSTTGGLTMFQRALHYCIDYVHGPKGTTATKTA